MGLPMVPEEQARKPTLATLLALALVSSTASVAGLPSAVAQPRPGDEPRADPPSADESRPARPETPPDTPPGQPDGDEQAAGDPSAQPNDRPWAQGVSPSDQAQANELFEAGDALLREFQLAAALRKYEAALTHWRHPAIHYRVASILLSQGKQVQAYAQNEQALRFGEAPLGEQFFANATRIKQQLESTLVWLTVSCQEAGADVRLDGELLFAGPGSEERVITAGAHTLVATKEGMIPATQNLALEGGKHTTIELTLRVEGARERFYPTRGRWGGSVATLIDAQGFDPANGQGLAVVAGASYGVMDNIDIEFGAILSGNPGAFVSTVFFLRKGLWRPTVFLTVPALWAGSFQPGARAGVGIEYTPTAWLAITAQAGMDYYPRATARFVSTLFAPAIGVKIRR